MLTKVDVLTDQGTQLELPMQDVSEGYYISEITGLDPVKATIVSSSFALLDGTQYQSGRREQRNIVMTLDLEPDYAIGSVQQLRTRLYGFFMPKSRIRMRFHIDEDLTVDIYGRIESFESALFTQEPTVAISVMCFDPDFYDPDMITFNGTTTSLGIERIIDYDGTTETGVLFNMPIDRDLTSFTIYNRTSDNVLQSLEFVAPLTIGQVLDISTVVGSKGANVTGITGTRSSILYGVSPYSSWIKLYPGANRIRVLAAGQAMPYTIRYSNKYGGL